MTRIAKYTKVVIINCIILLIIFFCLELSFRVYSKIIGKSPSDGWVIDDDKYGWVHNVNFTGRISKNKCDEDVLMKTPPHRLIIKFPKYQKAEITVLFIGDSFTHAHEVSTGKAYYDAFEELGEGKYRVFAAAVGGFGTLQEFMILEEVYENIRPDYVIWQMCYNDFNNNVFELDKASFFNTQRKRPYYDLKTGKRYIDNPGFWPLGLSHGLQYVFVRVVAFDLEYKTGLLKWLDSFIKIEQKKRAEYDEMGFNVAETLIQNAIEKYPKTKFIGFAVNNLYNEKFEQIFINNGANYWEKFGKFMNDHENTNCLPLDDHWNHYGNVVAGKKLFELFTKLTENDKQ